MSLNELFIYQLNKENIIKNALQISIYYAHQYYCNYFIVFIFKFNFQKYDKK